MIEVKIDGITKWQVNEYTFTDPQMGIRSISMTVKHPSMWAGGDAVPEVADFNGAYVEYDGETYNISSSKPTAEKSNTSLDYIYTLIFKGEEDELTRRKVRNLALVSVDNYVSQGTIFSISATISQFANLIENNLTHYFGDKWSVNLSALDSDTVQVDVNNISLWDLLVKTYEYYGVRWNIRGNVINIGVEPEYIEHVFDYGAEGGLVKITRTAPDMSIVNRLSGMGGTRNVPMNYFTSRYSNFPPDPNPINDTVYIRNIMPKVFRDSVIAGSLPYKDYVEDLASIAVHGIREDALAPNEDIYPSIAGVTVTGLGRIDELVAAEVPEVSDPDDDLYLPTFDIWIKDIGFDLSEDQYTASEDAKIHFTTGELAGYEFVILAVNGVRKVEIDTTKSYGGVSSMYKVTLIKSDEELDAYGQMLPNAAYKAQAGDKFVILNIEMPHSYVLNAEQKVQDWLEDKLEELSKDKPAYTIEPMDAFFEEAEVELDGKTIASKLKAGNKLSVNNTKITDGEQELYINNVVISYGKSVLPKYSLTVTDRVQVNGGSVARLQSQVDALVDRQYFTQAEVDAMLTGSSKRYISKVRPDGTNYYLRLRGGAEFGSFSSGMFTGKGGRVDERGNAEFEALRIRSLLEVPEIRYNRLTLVGEEIAVGGGGIIEDVWQDKDEEGVVIDPDVYVLKMKLEEGEMLPFFLHDIIKGIYNQAGAFRTSWFRVSNVNHSEGTITVVMASNEAVPGGSNYPPMPFMNIARIGNFVDETRQSSIFISAKEGSIYMLDKVDNYMAGVRSFQLGKPAGLENVIDFSKFSQINQEQGYLYARGIMVRDIIEVDYLGAPVRPKRDRGIWSLETAQNEPYEFNDRRQDLVWVGWSRYLCIVDGTLEEPSEGATDWVMDLNIKDAFDESVTDIYEGLDNLAGQINATESNLGELTGAFNTLRDETLVAMEDGLISEAERRSLYAIYVRLDIEQEQLLSDVMYAINSIYMPPIYKDKLQSISDKFLSAGGSLDQYQASIGAILDHADPHITDYEREEYNRTLLIYSRDHTKLVNALRDSRLAIDAEIKRLANEKTEEVEGGKNLIRNYDQRWGWDFWGGDGMSIDIDLDAITIVNQRGLIDDGNLIEDESGNIIEMV